MPELQIRDVHDIGSPKIYKFEDGQTIKDLLLLHGKGEYYISSKAALHDDLDCSFLVHQDDLVFKERCIFFEAFPDLTQAKRINFSAEETSLKSILKFDNSTLVYHRRRRVSYEKILDITVLNNFTTLVPFKVKIGNRTFEAAAEIEADYLDATTRSSSYLKTKACEGISKRLGWNLAELTKCMENKLLNVHNLIDLNSSVALKIEFPYHVWCSIEFLDESVLFKFQKKEIIHLAIPIEDEDVLDGFLKVDCDSLASKVVDAFKKKFGDLIDVEEVKSLLPTDLLTLISRRPYFNLLLVSRLFLAKIDESKEKENVAAERDRYLLIGSKCRVQNDPCIKEFGDLFQKLHIDATNYIQHLYNSEDMSKAISDLPYISVVAPSGAGKTQLCYTLQARFPGRFIKIFIRGRQYQLINEDKRGISDLLLKLFRWDSITFFKYLSHEVYWLDSGAAFAHPSVCNRRLPCFGVVVALLAIATKSDYACQHLNYPTKDDIPELDDLKELPYRKLSFTEAIYHLAKFEKPIPCILLDGFNGQSDNTFPLLRNVLRGLGIGCVTLGSDPKDFNLFKEQLGWKSSLPTVTWVYVWARLPKMTSASLPMSEKLLEIKATVQHYKEWLQFFDWFESIPSANCRLMTFAAEEIIVYCSQDGYQTKPFHEFFAVLLFNLRSRMNSIRGNSVGDLATNFKFWREDLEKQEFFLESKYIEDHYALLDFSQKQPQGNYYWFTLTLSELKEFLWRPCARFPEVQNNELFYLTFGAAKHPVRQLYFSTASSIHRFWQFKREILHESPLDSASQLLYNTMFMIASRLEVGCLAGTDLQAFLKHLIKALDYRTNRIYSIKDSPVFKKISAKLPYLGPMDSKFSETFKGMEGILVRCLESAPIGEDRVIVRMVRQLSTDNFCVLEGGRWRGSVSVKDLVDMISQAYESNFKSNTDPSVPELFFVFGQTFSEHKTCTQYDGIQDLLKVRNIVLLKLMSPPESKNALNVEVELTQRVLQNDPSKPTIYVILFSITGIYGYGYCEKLEQEFCPRRDRPGPEMQACPEDREEEPLEHADATGINTFQVPSKRCLSFHET